MMSKKVVKNLFIGVLIWLPVQYGMTGIIGYYHSEPWPALVFPGFKNVYVHEGGFEIAQTRFEVLTKSSIKPIILQPQQIFSEIPLSQLPGFMRTHFSDAEAIQTISPQAVRWLERQVSGAVGNEPLSMDVVNLIGYYALGEEGAIRDSTAELQRITIRFGVR